MSAAMNCASASRSSGWMVRPSFAADKQSKLPKATQVATVRTGIDCRRVYELLQNPVSRAVIRIAHRGTGPIAQRHICSGSFLNLQAKVVITTAAHCFFNRRTGTRIDPKEFTVGLIDESEFPIKDATIGDYDIKTGGKDIAFVELFDEVSFKNFNDQCVKKQDTEKIQ